MNICKHCGAPQLAEDPGDRQLLAICIVLLVAFGVMMCAGMTLAGPLFGF